jgi:hypothetical protein
VKVEVNHVGREYIHCSIEERVGAAHVSFYLIHSSLFSFLVYVIKLVGGLILDQVLSAWLRYYI